MFLSKDFFKKVEKCQTRRDVFSVKNCPETVLQMLMYVGNMEMEEDQKRKKDKTKGVEEKPCRLGGELFQGKMMSAMVCQTGEQGEGDKKTQWRRRGRFCASM